MLRYRRKRKTQKWGAHFIAARRQCDETGCRARGVDRYQGKQCPSTLGQTLDVIVVDQEIGRKGDRRLIGGRSGPKLRVQGTDTPYDEPRAEWLTRVHFGGPVHPLDREWINLGVGLARSEET